MTLTNLDSKLKTVLSQQDEDEIYSTCLEYLNQLPSQDRLTFILEDSFEEDSKPTTMKSSLLTKVIDEIGFNPFNLEYWSFFELDSFIEKQFSFQEEINLDNFKSTDLTTLVTNVIDKIVKTYKQGIVYSISFDYEVGDHEYFTSYIFFGPDGEIHTLVCYDEQNGVEVDRFNIRDIIECYLETK